jgi:hypothetical protein
MMIQVGSLVKVLYPKDLCDYRGIVEASEDRSGRWIIRLENNSLDDSKEPLLLSLDESEIEVIFLEQSSSESKSSKL